MAGQVTFDVLARDGASAVFGRIGGAADRAAKRLNGVHGSTSKLARSGIAQLGAFAGVAGIGLVIKQSAALEQSYSRTMRQVSAATGASGKDMQKLGKLSMQLGASTSFSANQAAGAMLDLGKAGVSTSDIMGGALKGTLLLASAGSLDLGQATTIAANAMNTFGLKGRDMGKIAAALAGGANASTASVESLGMGLAQVGPGARNAGLSLQQTVGVLSAFDQAGIKGSDAGTSLKTMLTRLVPSTKAARTEMSSLGLDFTDSKGNIDDVTTVAQKLHDTLGPLSQEQRNTALQTMFGSDATRAATVLMNQGSKGLAKYIQATKDQGAAQKMARANMQGTAGAMERLHGAVETAELALGQAMAPTIVKVANALSTKAVPAVTRFIKGMQNGTGAGGALADNIRMVGDVVGPALSKLKDLASAWNGMSSGKKKFSIAIAAGAITAHSLGLDKLALSIARPAATAVTSKVLPQNVFVVNMPKGGLPGTGGPTPVGAPGKGGKIPPAVPLGLGGKLFKFGAEGAAVLGLQHGLSKLDDVIFHTSLKSKDLNGEMTKFAATGRAGKGMTDTYGKSLEKLGSSAHRVSAVGLTGMIEKFNVLDKAIPGKQDSEKTVQNFKDIDSAVSKLTFKDPVAGAKAYGRLMKAAGKNSDDLARSLPKASAAMAGLGGAGIVGGMKGVVGQIVRQAGAAGQLSKIYRKLPKGVQTKISTPGAITSAAQVMRLGKQYHLTPKQVKTILKAEDLASPKAKTAAKNTKNLKGKDVKLTAKDGISGPAKTGKGNVDNVKGKHVDLSAHDGITGPARSASGAIAGVHSKSVTLTVTRITNFVKHISTLFTSRDGGPIGGLAGGGKVRGPGGPRSDSIMGIDKRTKAPTSWVSNGEFVVNARAYRRNRRLVEAINGGLPGFAAGGKVNHHGSSGHGHSHGGHPHGFKHIDLSKEGERMVKDVVKGLRHGHKVHLSKAITAMVAEFKRLHGVTKDLKARKRDFAGGYQGFKSSVFGADYGTEAPRTDQILAYAKGQLQKAQTLKADQRKLIGMGLSKDEIRQFASSGDSGVATLHALATGGSKRDIRELNSLNASTNRTLQGAGNQAGNRVFNDRIRAAQHNEDLARRIAKHLKALDDNTKHTTVTVKIGAAEFIREVKRDNKRNGRKTAGM